MRQSTFKSAFFVAISIFVAATLAFFPAGAYATDDVSESEETSVSKENSWRYENGELIDPGVVASEEDDGIEAQSMHVMPSGAVSQGIDVSGYQKDIDWQAVKNAGIDFAIIKIGNLDESEPDAWYTDSRFVRNVSECERLGIPYGIYVYAYGKSTWVYEKGADHIISLLAGHHPSLPIYLDLEDDTINPSKSSITKANLVEFSKAFCNRIAAAGYTPGIYSGASWFKYYLTDSCYSNSGWSIWTAQYWYSKTYNESLDDTPEYPSSYDIWQYSSVASVSGISGTVDINYCYTKLGNEIKSFSRVSGSTRYSTMSALASYGQYATGGTVVLASGDNYPDALTASSIAGSYNAPILLTEKGSLSSDAASQIKSLSPSKIYVVGGPDAISDSAVNAVRSAAGSSCQIQRVYGATRYETSLQTLSVLSSSDTVIIATGDNYADALSISPYAYAMKTPIVLCSSSSGLSDQALAKISAFGAKRAIIVGGTAAVPSVVESQLAKIGIADRTRLDGATRYETSFRIAAYETTNLGSNSFSKTTLYFATGSNYPDALAAGAIAGKARNPLILVDPSASTTSACISQWKGQVSKGLVIGGTNAISAYQVTALASALGLS